MARYLAAGGGTFSPLPHVLLPAIEFSLSSFKTEYFNPKSMKIKENCQETLQLLKLVNSLIVSHCLSHQPKLLSGKLTILSPVKKGRLCHLSIVISSLLQLTSFGTNIALITLAENYKHTRESKK